MIYESKEHGLVDLSQMAIIRKDFLLKDKKFLLLIRLNIGLITWAYNSAEDRDAEYEAVKKKLMK